MNLETFLGLVSMNLETFLGLVTSQHELRNISRLSPHELRNISRFFTCVRLLQYASSVNIQLVPAALLAITRKLSRLLLQCEG